MDASNELLDQFKGTLVGCGIGDALGFPYEGLGPDVLWNQRYELVKRFHPHPSGIFPPGQVSDDTQLTLALTDAIIEKRMVDGKSIARQFAKLWEQGTIIGRGFACDYAMRNIMDGIAWNEAGAPEGRAGNGTAMRASPIGLWNYGTIDRILRDARTQSLVTHQDPRATAGATAIATAIALNLEQPELESKADRQKYLQSIGNQTTRAHELFGTFIMKLDDYLLLPIKEALSSIRTAGYTGNACPDWPGISPFVIPTTLVALFAFLRTPNNFSEIVSVTLGAGGDVDTTSAIAGALSGAYNGMAKLPRNLKQTVMNRRRLASSAADLYEAVGQKNQWA